VVSSEADFFKRYPWKRWPAFEYKSVENHQPTPYLRPRQSNRGDQNAARVILFSLYQWRSRSVAYWIDNRRGAVMKYALGHVIAATGAATTMGDAGIMIATFIIIFYLMVGIWLDAFSMYLNSDNEDEEGKNWWETPEQAKRRKRLRKNQDSDF
jgi:hypothetical protein